MNDKFDKKLTDTFREKFEHFSEPYNAQNWSKLEPHLFSLKRIRMLKYSLGMAACLGLLTVVVILFTIYPEDHTTPTIGKNILPDRIESTKSSLPISDINESGNQDITKLVRGGQDLSENNIFMLPGHQKEEVISISNKQTGIRKPAKVSPDIPSLADHLYIHPGSSKEKNKIKFGFVFSPQVHQTKNDYEAEVNFAGGISSEFPLFSQVKLDVGILLSQQNIGFENDIRPTLEARNVLGGDQFKKTEARLLALDIPINLKYDLIEASESNVFIIVGISSLAYFKEQYSNIYYAENTLDVYGENQRIITVFREEDSSVDAFHRFDLAKILNVSLGMGYRFRNNMEMQIEPFVKYPLGPVTSENIKIGSGGIQFRIYF